MDDATRLADVFLQVSTLSSQCDNSREQIQSINREIPALRCAFRKIEHSFLEMQSTLDAYKAEMDKLKSLVAVIREEMARNLNSHQKEVASDLDKKDSAIRAVLYAIDDMNKKIESMGLKIEDVSLNSKNAILKSEHSDMLVQIYRKKLDNIQIMLQRNQNVSS